MSEREREGEKERERERDREREREREPCVGWPAHGFIPFLGRQIKGYLDKGIETPMAQGRSHKIILMI